MAFLKGVLPLANNKRNVIIAVLLIAIGTILRFAFTYFPPNYDFFSSKILGEIAVDYGNVYALTTRYNYGSIYYILLGVLYKISLLSSNSEIAFRYLIVMLLTMTDIGLSLYIFTKHKNILAMSIFYLNPISIIITGVHHQFDNIAILLMLIAISFVNPEKTFNKKDIIFNIFFSLSLITKHVFAFFIFWILINNTLPLIKRLIYCTIPPMLFLCSFLPFFKGDGISGIVNNVFLYKSFNNFPLLLPLRAFLELPNSLFMPTFILIVCFWAIYFRKKSLDFSVLLYSFCVVAFSSAVANQYLAIPLVSLALLTKNLRYVYGVLVGLFLVFEKNGLNFISRFMGEIQPDEYSFIQSIVSRYYAHFGYLVACTILAFAVLKYTEIFPQKIKSIL